MIYKTYKIFPIAIERDIPEANVACGTCNLCCTHLSPYLTPDEFESGKYVWALLENPGGSPSIGIPRNKNGCVYYENGCTIYEDRPKACRQFSCIEGHYPPFKDHVKEKFNIEMKNYE